LKPDDNEPARYLTRTATRTYRFFALLPPTWENTLCVLTATTVHTWDSRDGALVYASISLDPDPVPPSWGTEFGGSGSATWQRQDDGTIVTTGDSQWTSPEMRIGEMLVEVPDVGPNLNIYKWEAERTKTMLRVKRWRWEQNNYDQITTFEEEGSVTLSGAYPPSACRADVVGMLDNVDLSEPEGRVPRRLITWERGATGPIALASAEHVGQVAGQPHAEVLVWGLDGAEATKTRMVTKRRADLVQAHYELMEPATERTTEEHPYDGHDTQLTGVTTIQRYAGPGTVDLGPGDVGSEYGHAFIDNYCGTEPPLAEDRIEISTDRTKL